MGDPPRTTDSNAQAQAQARANKQNARAISHQPSSVAHRTKAITRLPISEGSRQNPDTRERRQFARSIAQSIVQYFLKHMPCCSPLQLDRSTDSTAVPACKLQRCRPKTDSREKDSFTVSLSCRRPREPGTSLHPRRNQRPSTINPNLNRPSSKRPFFRRAIR